ncbi:hypothetical protein DVH24_020961 [Malus domestica]|uniref:Uncharacterized protein n=1 Tax=Malus domestica TaxID=3750 RepID=A0A498J8C2_MALDO|nr:hypothetical protein DVH24_020961 [Malus domestica]
MPEALFRWLLQLHKDVPKAAWFYAEGLDFTVNPIQALPYAIPQVNSPSPFSETLCSELKLDGPIKYEVHGKVMTKFLNKTVVIICSYIIATLGAEILVRVSCYWLLPCDVFDGHMLGLYEPA